MRILLACALLPVAASAQMTALVNDPMSHGTRKDNLLSLDEAINVMNTTLKYADLSAAEQAQLRGSPTTVLDTIEIDFLTTPVITLERQLTDIFGDTVAHVDCNFFSLNGRVLIDATRPTNPLQPIAETFPVRTNHFHLEDFVVRGGGIGVNYNSSQHYHPGEKMWARRCRFEQQTAIGVRIWAPRFPPLGIEPSQLLDNTFFDLPIGVEIFDDGFSGDIDLEAARNTFDGCDTAIHFQISGQGSSVDATFHRDVITGATHGVRTTWSMLSDTALNAAFVHTKVYASGSGFDFQGGAAGATTLTLAHATVRAGGAAGDYAFSTSPATATFRTTLVENELDGAVRLLAFGAAEPTLRNCRLENGPLSVESTAGATLEQVVLRSAPLTVLAGTTRAVNLTRCELVHSPVQDLTAGGQTTLSSCYLASSSLGAGVTNQSPVSAPWIGRATVWPQNPPRGSYVDLAVDLHPGTVAAWMVGVSAAKPATNTTPYRFYFDLGLPTLALPGLFRFQQTLRVPLPNSASLAGVEVYAQPVMVPVPGQSPAPPVSLPRGGRFTMQ